MSEERSPTRWPGLRALKGMEYEKSLEGGGIIAKLTNAQEKTILEFINEEKRFDDYGTTVVLRYYENMEL